MPKRSKRRTQRPRRERRLSIRSELRTQPDLAKIAGAVVALAMAQAEKDAQAQREQQEHASHD